MEADCSGGQSSPWAVAPRGSKETPVCGVHIIHLYHCHHYNHPVLLLLILLRPLWWQTIAVEGLPFIGFINLPYRHLVWFLRRGSARRKASTYRTIQTRQTVTHIHFPSSVRTHYPSEEWQKTAYAIDFARRLWSAEHIYLVKLQAKKILQQRTDAKLYTETFSWRPVYELRAEQQFSVLKVFGVTTLNFCGPDALGTRIRQCLWWARARPADVASRDRQELQLDLTKRKSSQDGRYWGRQWYHYGTRTDIPQSVKRQLTIGFTYLHQQKFSPCRLAPGWTAEGSEFESR
jgi:hypothetical protein